jgi:hypothetical protein
MSFESGSYKRLITIVPYPIQHMENHYYVICIVTQLPNSLARFFVFSLFKFGLPFCFARKPLMQINILRLKCQLSLWGKKNIIFKVLIIFIVFIVGLK